MNYPNLMRSSSEKTSTDFFYISTAFIPANLMVIERSITSSQKNNSIFSDFQFR